MIERKALSLIPEPQISYDPGLQHNDRFTIHLNSLAIGEFLAGNGLPHSSIRSLKIRAAWEEGKNLNLGGRYTWYDNRVKIYVSSHFTHYSDLLSQTFDHLNGKTSSDMNTAQVFNDRIAQINQSLLTQLLSPQTPAWIRNSASSYNRFSRNLNESVQRAFTKPQDMPDFSSFLITERIQRYLLDQEIPLQRKLDFTRRLFTLAVERNLNSTLVHELAHVCQYRKPANIPFALFDAAYVTTAVEALGIADLKAIEYISSLPDITTQILLSLCLVPANVLAVSKLLFKMRPIEIDARKRQKDYQGKMKLLSFKLAPQDQPATAA